MRSVFPKILTLKAFVTFFILTSGHVWLQQKRLAGRFQAWLERAKGLVELGHKTCQWQGHGDADFR